MAGLLFGSLAHADAPRTASQVASDCAHAANDRNLAGDARNDFLEWCNGAAARFPDHDVRKRYARYDACAAGARSQGYKGDDSQRYLDWCVSQAPDQATASNWESYRRGQVNADCPQAANDRNLIGDARHDFLKWCTDAAARFPDHNVTKRYARYDACAAGARSQGYKGDDRQRYLDWCVSQAPDQATASNWQSYRNGSGNGSGSADCAHAANDRKLTGDARNDFLAWCTGAAARFPDHNVTKRYARYDACATGARTHGYKGDDRQRYMDWCVDQTPDRATANYWDSYKGCYAKATDRGFHDADRRDYIERCLEGGRNVDSNLWQTYQQCFETADDRKLGGDAREDYVNRCVSRGDQKTYDSMATRTRSCSQRARSLNLNGREYDRFVNWCLNPYSDKDDDYARRWERDRRCYVTADDRNLTGERRRDYLEQCLGYGKYSFNN